MASFELKYYCNPRTIAINYLKTLKHIKKIDLSNNVFTDVDLSEFTDFNNLTTIDLQFNRLNNIEFPDNNNILSVNLYSNYLTSYPETLSKLCNLNNLSFGENKITHIPDDITKLSNLETLHYINIQSYSNLKITNKLSQLYHLKDLTICANGYLNFDYSCLQHLHFLKKVNLSNNNLTVLPTLSNSVEVVMLSNNKIKTADLNYATSLKMLCLNNNLLTHFPVLDKCTNLQHLGLSSNFISDIPTYIIDFELRYLDISCNKITLVPKIFKRTPYKQAFNFYGNNINTIHHSICLFNNVRELTLHGNSLPDTSVIIKKAVLRTISKFRSTYFKGKYGKALERFYIKNVRNKHINLELQYSPYLPFYLKNIDTTVLMKFKPISITIAH